MTAGTDDEDGLGNEETLPGAATEAEPTEPPPAPTTKQQTPGDRLSGRSRSSVRRPSSGRTGRVA